MSGSSGGETTDVEKHELHLVEDGDDVRLFQCRKCLKYRRAVRGMLSWPDMKDVPHDCAGVPSRFDRLDRPKKQHQPHCNCFACLTPSWVKLNPEEALRIATLVRPRAVSYLAMRRDGYQVAEEALIRLIADAYAEGLAAGVKPSESDDDEPI